MTDPHVTFPSHNVFKANADWPFIALNICTTLNVIKTQTEHLLRWHAQFGSRYTTQCTCMQGEPQLHPFRLIKHAQAHRASIACAV